MQPVESDVAYCMPSPQPLTSSTSLTHKTTAAQLRSSRHQAGRPMIGDMCMRVP
ncbi:hypothetical protein SVAN01_06219 [Stagonosporopsis vannaccii]|nr:hypothetical protein SVAN01_06219 [Stagonosporopsis vannaccii]